MLLRRGIPEWTEECLALHDCGTAVVDQTVPLDVATVTGWPPWLPTTTQLFSPEQVIPEIDVKLLGGADWAQVLPPSAELANAAVPPFWLLSPPIKH
jgi:hypothetical protein